MKSAGEKIAEVYERLVRERNAKKTRRWTKADRATWAIVTARCQKDFGGVESIFTDSSAGRVSDALEWLGETRLAAKWREASQALEKRGYLVGGRWRGGAADAACRRIFDRLDKALGDRLWDLDDALATARTRSGRRSTSATSDVC